MNGIKFRAGDEIIISLANLHRDPDQYQRPSEFLPQRWDPEDPLYLTPAGKKRHAFCYSPFAAGRRACIAKTFSEFTPRIILLYLTMLFDFEFKDKSWYTNENLPMAHIG